MQRQGCQLHGVDLACGVPVWPWASPSQRARATRKHLRQQTSRLRTWGVHAVQIGQTGEVTAVVPVEPMLPIDDSPLPSDAEVVPLQSPFREASSGRFKGLKAFVAGATGGTGQAIVKQLVVQGVPVRALVRDMTKAVRLLPSNQDGVEVLTGDVYQYATIPPAMEGCNVVIIATGTQPIRDPFGPYNVDYQGTVNIVAAAKQKGIKKIVLVSSIGADEPFFPLNLLFGVLFWKKRAEEEVQRSGINYTIVRPGGLLNEPRQGQVAGGIVMAGPGTYGLPPKRTPNGPILRSQVAEICIQALVEPLADNKVVEVVTDQAQPPQPYNQLFASVW